MALTEHTIRASWALNAAAWTRAVRERRIASRRLVTDQAIVAAILRHRPAEILDIGCGEGWLMGALAAEGIAVMGCDGEPALVAAAAAHGPAVVADYHALAAGALGQPVAAAVCNFSLLGQAAEEALIAAMPRLLCPGGRLFIQTLHPWTACGEAPYVSGWRAGSWAGFDDSFRDAHPWYFRTLGDWIGLLVAAGLTVDEVTEPLHPDTGRPASLILVARRI